MLIEVMFKIKTLLLIFFLIGWWDGREGICANGIIRGNIWRGSAFFHQVLGYLRALASSSTDISPNTALFAHSEFCTNGGLLWLLAAKAEETSGQIQAHDPNMGAISLWAQNHRHMKRTTDWVSKNLASMVPPTIYLHSHNSLCFCIG